MEEAETAYKAAEERFVAGDIAGAIMCSRRFSSSHRDLGNALAAYEVHAAAPSLRWGGGRGSGGWYAVLGVEASGVTHEAIKKQYHRLCLVLHPDKNRSAAADGAFKLIRQAWDALSARHPPGGGGAAQPEQQPCPGPEFWSGGGPRRSGSGGAAEQPDPRQWYGREYWGEPDYEYEFDPETGRRRRAASPPPPSARRSRSWQPAYAGSRGRVFCGNCGSSDFGEENDDESEERCRSCFGRFRRQTETPGTESPADMPPPPPPPAQKATPASQPRRARSGGPIPIFCANCGSSDFDEDDVDERCRSCSGRFTQTTAEATAPSPGTDAEPSPLDDMEEEEEEVPRPPPPANPPPPPPSQPPTCATEAQAMEEDEEDEVKPTPQPPRYQKSRRYFPCPGQCARCGTRVRVRHGVRRHVARQLQALPPGSRAPRTQPPHGQRAFPDKHLQFCFVDHHRHLLAGN